jgi:hypothetical protein
MIQTIATPPLSMSDTAFTVARKSCPGKEVMAGGESLRLATGLSSP